jgi:hypothetical protein
MRMLNRESMCQIFRRSRGVWKDYSPLSGNTLAAWRWGNRSKKGDIRGGKRNKRGVGDRFGGGIGGLKRSKKP